MVNCEQTREELAVQALFGNRHGGLDAESSEHLVHCAECSAEQRRLADVTLVLSSVGLLAFEGLPAAGARPPGRTPEPRETAPDARDCTCPQTGHPWRGTADRVPRATDHR
ncbi:hypothetical protein AB0941_28025 [Streptomyces sp. NPDC013433]|uniref:hypothetical protein n=1 Tax=Streptomyces sp. NPDC013433 TaxID=3155604 RepID=UPI003454397C